MDECKPLIAGFCGETEEEHADTVDLMRQAGVFLFAPEITKLIH